MKNNNETLSKTELELQYTTSVTQKDVTVDSFPQNESLLNECSIKKDTGLFLEKPATGKRALAMQLSVTHPIVGTEFWIKQTYKRNEIFRCINLGDGNFELYSTTPQLDEDGLPAREGTCMVWEDDVFHPDGYSFVINQMDGQWFILPGLQEGGIGKQHSKGSNVAWFEIDNLSLEEQRERIEEFTRVSGLRPALVTFSGNKSLHTIFKFDRIISTDELTRVLKKLILIFNSDITLAKSCQVMRLASLMRQNTGNLQTVDLFDEKAVHNFEKFEETINGIYDLPPDTSETQWSRYLKLRTAVSHPTHEEVIVVLNQKEEARQEAQKYISDDSVEANSEVIPLFEFLGKDYKSLVNKGLAAGTAGREPKLRDLVGRLTTIVDDLNKLGILHDNDVAGIAYKYAANCNPPLPDYEVIRHLGKATVQDKTPDASFYVKRAKWLFKDNPEQLKKILAKFSEVPKDLNDDSSDCETGEIDQEYEDAVSLSDYHEQKRQDTEEYKQQENVDKFFDEITGDLITERRKEEAIKNFKDNAKYRWNIYRTFTPTTTIESSFVSDALTPETVGQKDIIGIKSGLGTGKTHWMRLSLDAWGGGVHVVGYRNMLGIQTAKNINGFHIHQDAEKFTESFAKPDARLVYCVDSITKFQTQEDLFKGKTIVIDEANSVMKHLLYSETFTPSRRRFCLSVFEKALKNCDRIVLLDGHLSNHVFDWFADLAGDNRNKIKVENNKLPDASKFSFLVGTIKDSSIWEGSNELTFDDRKHDNINSTDHSSMEKAVIANQGKFAVIGDCAKKLQSMYNVKLNANPAFKGLVITADTSKEPRVIEFLQDSINAITTHQYDGIFYSPTAESGIDINIRDYFKDQYCFIYANIGASEAKQMIFRLRDPKPTRHLWVSPVALGMDADANCNSETFRSKNIGQLKATFDQVIEKVGNDDEAKKEDFDISKYISDITESFHSPNNKAIGIVAAVSDYEQANCRECLIDLLQESGHEINFLVDVPDANAKELVKEEKNKLQFEFCEKVADANLLRDNEYQELKAKSALSQDEKAAVEKYQLNEMCPGIVESPKFFAGFIYYVTFKERGSLTELQRFYLLKNPEILQKQFTNSLVTHHNIFLKEKNTKFIISDWRKDMLKLQALADAGFTELINPNLDWHSESPEIQTIKKNISTVKFQQKWGLELSTSKRGEVKPKYFSDEAAMKFIKKCMDWAGIQVKCTGRIEVKEEKINRHGKIEIKSKKVSVFKLFAGHYYGEFSYTPEIFKTFERKFSDNPEQFERPILVTQEHSDTDDDFGSDWVLIEPAAPKVKEVELTWEEEQDLCMLRYIEKQSKEIKACIWDKPGLSYSERQALFMEYQQKMKETHEEPAAPEAQEIKPGEEPGLSCKDKELKERLKEKRMQKYARQESIA